MAGFKFAPKNKSNFFHTVREVCAAVTACRDVEVQHLPVFGLPRQSAVDTTIGVAMAGCCDIFRRAVVEYVVVK